MLEQLKSALALLRERLSKPSSAISKAVAVFHAPLAYRFGDDFGRLRTIKWLAVTSLLAVVSLITNYLGFATIFTTVPAVLAAAGLQILVSTAGYELIYTANKQARSIFFACWLLCVWLSMTFDAIALDDLHFRYESAASAPILAQGALVTAAGNLSNSYSQAKMAALGALGHESRAIAEHLARANRRVNLDSDQDQTSREVLMAGLVGRKSIVDGLIKSWQDTNFDTAQIASMKPVDAWSFLQSQYHTLVNKWASVQSAAPGATYTLPAAPMPPVAGLDSVNSGQADVFGGPLSRLFPYPKDKTELFFLLCSAAFEIPALLLAIGYAYSEQRPERDIERKGGGDNRTFPKPAQSKGATDDTVDAPADSDPDTPECLVDSEEPGILDWDRRERRVRRYGDSLFAYDHDERIVTAAADNAKAAMGHSLANLGLDHRLQAFEEGIEVFRAFAADNAAPRELVDAFVSQCSCQIEGELHAYWEIINTERKVRVARSHVALARQIAAMEIELSEIGAVAKDYMPGGLWHFVQSEPSATNESADTIQA